MSEEGAYPVRPHTSGTRLSDDDVVAGLAAAIDPPGRIISALRRVGRRIIGGPEHDAQHAVAAWVSLIIVGFCVAFVLLQLGPANIFSSSTPAGGDMGAHVWGPAYMRDHLLPSFRLTGWAPDWFAGFPAYQYYMVLPSLSIALLSLVIPYGVAFKLIAIFGVLTLPVACWIFARLVRLPFPAPPLFAVGATLFLFDRSFSIYGGNIASTMAGEFSCSISLTFAIVFLGVVGRGLETGRHRVLAAVLLSITGLCHVLPFLFAVVGAVVWLVISAAYRTGWFRRLWWLVGSGVVGVALMSWWILPFALRTSSMNDMGWEKKTNYLNMLLQRENLDPQLVNSPPIGVIALLALLGVFMSIVWRRRGGIYLASLAAASAAAFVLMPQGRIWNARILPFWYLCLYLLAAVGVAELGRALATILSRDPDQPNRAVLVITAVAAALVGIVALAMPLRAMPENISLGPINIELGGPGSDGAYHWLFLSTTDSSFVPAWARWNFTGYEGKPAYPEYHDIVSTMSDLGQTNGCGRAMWEYEEQHDRYGTPMALMLLPFWTDGCIGSMEGLYFESSATAPYHWLNGDELSTSPSNPQRGLPYVPGAPTRSEFALGVEHLQMLGVRYYMAISPTMIDYARSNASLTEVATSGPWVVFEVTGSELVTPLQNEPAVLTGVAGSTEWLDAVLPWYSDPSAWSVPLSAGGPASWQRIAPGEQPVAVPVEPVGITDIRTTTDRISFSVSRIGVPVYVKTSYFPNWKANGAEGPWRVSPNLMVVVPTSDHVTLEFGDTSVEYLSWIITVLGLVGLVALWKAGPLALPEPRPWFPGRRGPHDGPLGSGAMSDPTATALDAIFKAYDIRGTVPDQLDAALVQRIGAAFARFVADTTGATEILIAHDMRPSGPGFADAFAAGAVAQGVDVVHLGLASTDLLFFAAGHFDRPGAMITASHNPAQYNGLKLCLSGARPIGEETGLREIKEATASGLPPADASGSVTRRDDALAAFVDHVHGFVELGSLRPLRVVADTANGMGGLTAPAVFAGLPFDLDVMYGELDGTFPNHPADPIQPENLVDLQARVRETGADVGLAFDGDADRVFLVDDQGQLVSGSLTTAIVADVMLKKNPGQIVLHNLICSKAVPEVIREAGGTPVRTRVGHSFIKQVMADTGACFGGEHSGHYYFRDNYRADSGIIAAMVVLELMSVSGKPLSELRIPYERHSDSGEINTKVPDPLAVIDQFGSLFAHAALDHLDGLTVDLTVGDAADPDDPWWFNLRPSNTEPLLRLNLEASTPELCAKHVDEIRALIAEIAASQ
jgi:phosphomannomutase